MNTKLLTIVAAACLAAGCSSTPQKSTTGPVEAAPITAINTQKLSSSFKRQGIKIEWGCTWGTNMFGLTDAMCLKGEVKAIEVTGYANSFGNSEALRERAFIAAEMDAKARMIRFINEGLGTSNYVQTITKNVEKAQDKIKNRIKSDEEVAVTDQDAFSDSNIAVRENTNEVVRTLSESIRNNAEGKLRGAVIKEADIVDRQTVRVTIRWDHTLDGVAQHLNKLFNR